MIPSVGLAADPKSSLPGEAIKQGHSLHGKAFDEGPRTKPEWMEDIGRIHMPITHKNPEVQRWFDQGVTLLHHFWDYEAERAFRWAWKLEPENAMVYWGLAKAVGGERSALFIREAAKRKGSVTERERLYIEALEALEATSTLRDRDGNYQERGREYKRILETLCVKYPDDMEARALLAYSWLGDDRYGTEKVVQEVLAKQPRHPGAHHYRIHNWNGHEPEQALPSAALYGRIAPGSGHALHMPGHIYATVGMWHEAGIAMDSATRVERRIMQKRQNFPFNHWNYGHNRNYLSYIEEQLGMVERALSGARQLVAAPLDPKQNSDNWRSAHSQGLFAWMRGLLRFERWDELLDAGQIPWREIFYDRMLQRYSRTRAYLGKANLYEAEKNWEEFAGLEKELEKQKEFETIYRILALELRARLLLAQGETLPGLTLLMQAAEKQAKMEREDSDPPKYPQLLYTVLGDVYLQEKSAALALAAYEKALQLSRNDIFALSGKVRALATLERKREGEEALAALLFTTSEADKNLAVLERALATGLKATPKDNSPAAQRNYARTPLDQFGPSQWQPFPAPAMELTTTEGAKRQLTEFAGKNIILVFYLGGSCPHCMQQLRELEKRAEEWSQADAVVLAVSAQTPEENSKTASGGKFKAVQFLSDPNHATAKRYLSYDEFEEMPLHSTILIDKKGRVHWGQTGGSPFQELNFLGKQLQRMNGSL